MKSNFLDVGLIGIAKMLPGIDSLDLKVKKNLKTKVKEDEKKGEKKAARSSI